jgi:hypothetical protein
MVLGNATRSVYFGVYDIAAKQFVKNGVSGNSLFAANSADDAGLNKFVQLMQQTGLKGEILPITSGVPTLDGSN